MWPSLKRLALGLTLIAAAAAVLLLSDSGRRRATRAAPRIAIVQHASQGVIDEGVQGMLDGLAAQGFVAGQTLSVRRYNAEGDMATANAIASEVASAGYDLLLTATTISLQTVANANRDGKTNHVFALVADPAGAGVGISGENPLDHPPHLAGFGTMQPVALTLEIAKRMFPRLRRIGVVWNPAESNSEANMKLARAAAPELGLEILEANAENTAAVGDAAASLAARGAQALWVGADVTALTAIDTLVAVARQARIPVFTSIPGNVANGTLFDLGFNYTKVGHAAGNLAAQVLSGTSPASVPITNLKGETLRLNPAALEGLKDPWQFPPDIVAEAEAAAAEPAAAPAAPPGRKFEIGVVYFAPEAGAENCLRGLLDGLRALGFTEGENLTVHRAHAQGEIANLSAALRDFDSRGLDLIVTLTTPALTAATTAVSQTPVVFTYVYDPIAAGAGTSFEQHLPHVTGVGSFPPVEDTVALIAELLPRAKVIGTIYNSSEANSRKVVSVAREAFARRGLQLEEVTVASSSEVFQAAQALLARGAEAFWITGDNTVVQGFDAVVRVAAGAGLAIVNNDPELAGKGVLACVGIGFYRSGYEAARLAARVLRGTSPGHIPMENIAEQTLTLNLEVAKALGVAFPPALLERADVRIDEHGAHAREPEKRETPQRAPDKTWQVAIVEYVDAPDCEDARRGVLDGLRQAGLVEGRDFTAKTRNAQGDMPTLSTLVDAAIGDGADLLVTLSTPALQAALQRAGSTPIVFTFVANPIAAGAGRSNEEHAPNVTGVPTVGAYAELMDVVRESLPSARRVGTLFVPAEVNSVHNKAVAEAAARERGLELVALPVNTSTEIADAALSLTTQRVDAIAQIGSNLTTVAFSSIAQAANRARLPLFGVLRSNAHEGAAVVVAREYYEGGVRAGHLAARIIRGESPAAIPFEPLATSALLANPEAAARQGWTIPDAVLRRAQPMPTPPR
ncbi:MAG: ABC transporter substrate-binding protein [Candidatus Binatia bacterium]